MSNESTTAITQCAWFERLTARRWETVEDLEKAFDRDARGFGIPKETKRGIDVANELRKFTVLGKPGAGKTTFLKYLALQAMGGELTEKLIPIFVALRDFVGSGKESLMDFIVEQFDICQFPEARPFIERFLEKGRCILLFDGLDEVSKDRSSQVVGQIRDFSDKYSDNHFALSCRIGAYSDYFDKFTNVEMADFTDDQIQDFINNWFNWSSGDTKKAELCWSKLCANKPIRELASTPLLLAMLCIAFDEKMDFPRTRSRLYWDAIDTLLRRWDAKRSIDRDEIYENMTSPRKESMLSRIAAQTFEEDRIFIPQHMLERHIANFIGNLPGTDQDMLAVDSAAILKAIEAQHGIFVERAKGIYSYSHLTVQEYFTARYIVDNAMEDTLQRLVRNHLTDRRWREVFLMTTEMLDQADIFLLMMAKQIDALIAHTELAQLLKEVPNIIRRQHLTCASSVSRALAAGVIIQRTLQNAVGYIHGDEALHNRLSSLGSSAFYLAVTLFAGITGFKADAAAWSIRWGDNPIIVTCGVPKHIFSITIDHEGALALGRDLTRVFADKPDLIELASIYIRVNGLCVDCINTECYISRDTRRKILENLLTPPDSPMIPDGRVADGHH